MNKIVNDVEYYTFSITIPIYKIKPPRNFQKYYQTHKDEIIVDLQKKNKTLKQELQRKDNIINELKTYLNKEIESFKLDGYDEPDVRQNSLWLAGCYDEDLFILKKIKKLEGKDEQR